MKRSVIGLMSALWATAIQVIGSVPQSLQAGENQPNRPFQFPALYTTIANAREAGLRKDKHQTRYLLSLLKNPPQFGMHLHMDLPPLSHVNPDIYPSIAALIALGRIADPQIVAELHPLRSKFPGLESYFDVTIARIRATATIPQVTTTEEWKRRVRCFLDALNVPRKQLQTMKPRRFQMALSKSETTELCEYTELVPIGVVTIRCLTEMASEAYEKGVRNAFQLLEAEGLSWYLDAPARLRVELTKVPPAERVGWLWQRLRRLDPELPYAIQAFVDSGEEAKQYLLDRLTPLMEMSDDTLNVTWIDRLFLILGGFESPEVDTLLSRLEARYKQEGRDHLALHVRKAINLRLGFGYPLVFAVDW